MAFVMKLDLSNFHIISDKYVLYAFYFSFFIVYFGIIIKDSVGQLSATLHYVYTTKKPDCDTSSPLVCHEMKLEWFLPFGDKVG